MPLYVQTEFAPNAVQPMQCVKDGWNVIKDQYWLFVGIALVGLLVGQLAPMGILMPPMLCGVYLSLFERMKGRQIEFGELFKGFDYFGQSVIAWLLHLVPVLVITLPLVAIIFASSIFLAPKPGEQNDAGVAVIVVFAIIMSLILVVISLVIATLFTFAFPLIVDRKLSGVDAVKLSMKAGLANFWGLLGLFLLVALMTLAGALFCYVGAFLVMPIGYAAQACAYREVFGLTQPDAFSPPPPPASFAGEKPYMA
ncbi:MAG TPA: hypothetical protein VGN86_15395 [Pyrinomonadaceae bacterium]|nr:hypothetical protein [Pyrinomonadaceae bacterium]